MDNQKISADVTEIFKDVFLRDDLVLKAEMTAKDVAGWDSFKQIEIIIAVEEHFGIKFHTRELDKLGCVGDLLSAVERKVSA